MAEEKTIPISFLKHDLKKFIIFSINSSLAGLKKKNASHKSETYIDKSVFEFMHKSNMKSLSSL